MNAQLNTIARAWVGSCLDLCIVAEPVGATGTRVTLRPDLMSDAVDRVNAALAESGEAPVPAPAVWGFMNRLYSRPVQGALRMARLASAPAGELVAA